MLLSAKKAIEISRDLQNRYTEEALVFLHKVSGDAAVMKKWLDAEHRLRNMRDIHEVLGDISWEDKMSEIDQLISDAEEEVNDAIESVNSWRDKLGIETEKE
jgi:hypothetical protein